MISTPPLRPVPNARLRANVRTFYTWIASMIVFGAGPLVAARLINQHTLVARIAGVVIGAGAMLPWMWVVFVMIRRADEYSRRIHLVALGAAFAAALILVVALAMLVRADFIGPPDLMVVWLTLLAIWFVALMGAKVYFERSA